LLVKSLQDTVSVLKGCYVPTVKNSAGTLLYRKSSQGIEVLLVHPSGNYNRRAPWSIPKGVGDENETLEDTARRETFEETGVQAGQLFPLGFSDYQKSRKRVHCFAGIASDDALPRCASWEVDQARFVPIDEAKELLHPDQRIFLDRLKESLGSGPAN
jgi:predicted NUDIX family NTP pyrophosphohydrolase